MNTQTEETKAKSVIAEAEVVAKNLIDTALKVSSDMIVDNDKRTTKSLSDALREVFEENGKTGRFVDVSRIPLICQNINGIHANISEIKDMIKEADARYVSNDTFWPIRAIVYSGAGIVLLAVAGAIVALVINK